MRINILNLSLSFILLFFLSVPASAGEHPSEHPSEHPEKKARKPTAKSEHPEHPTKKEKSVSKAEIAKGIKVHIRSAEKEGGGVYRMNYEGTELALTLKRVHRDKLAQLENGQFFACTDFDGSDGNTYDMDFFLRGTSGDMKVTDATVHKINGSPLYNWWQRPDEKWVKIPLPK